MNRQMLQHRFPTGRYLWLVMAVAVGLALGSQAAAVTLLWLAQTYGDGVLDFRIKDYVPVTAPHNGWERVTFGDALNMATGIGNTWPQREPNHPFNHQTGSANHVVGGW